VEVTILKIKSLYNPQKDLYDSIFKILARDYKDTFVNMAFPNQTVVVLGPPLNIEMSFLGFSTDRVDFAKK